MIKKLHTLELQPQERIALWGVFVCIK